MRDEAIGAWEASAIMGVHWSRPAKMAADGVIFSRVVGAAGDRVFAVYSRRECEENYQDYLDKMDTQDRPRRPRTALHNRDAAIEALKDAPKIKFGDAIGVAEAAKMLGVWWTLVPRLAQSGKILGRVLYSERRTASRLWIVSRESCERHAADISRQEQAGTKRGRLRHRVDQ